MIRAVVRPTDETPAATTGTTDTTGVAAVDENSLQAMIDAAEPGKTLTIPAGTYEGADQNRAKRLD